MNMTHGQLARVVVGVSVGLVAAAAYAASLRYPPAPTGSIVDVYHGVKVADPYRVFEQPDAPQTRAWIAAENALSQPYLEAIPQRAWLKQRLGELWNYERYGVPKKEGGRYFFLRNDGTQNQSVLYVTESIDSDGRVLFDPNAASGDATIALARFEPSPDGNLLAYSLQDGGTDWEIWKFRRVVDGVDLEDELHRVKFWQVSWARDGSGVYYSLYPPRTDSKAGEKRGDDAGRPAVYFHRLGEPQDKDRLVYAVTDHPARVPSADITDDGKLLVITIADGTKTSGIVLKSAVDPAAPAIPLFDKFDANYNYLGSDDRNLYFSTTSGAPRWRIVAVDRAEPSAATARTIVPEAAAAIAEASFSGGRLVVVYVQDARNVVKLFEPDGRFAGDVALPGPGSAGGFRSGSDPETFFAFGDYLLPTRILRLDVPRDAVAPFRTPKIKANTDQFVTVQKFYPSKDGTRIPMFITHRRDMPLDGNQPVLLYGYGGFNVSLTPAFRPTTLAWLEMGGVYVEANLRGGGEYGEAWHDAGTLARKQNVFDDFIAAAEFLIREKYTKPERLAILGRSNGGLLVGATMLQRPDLFAAALPAVGVLDMLRYHTASANARQWSGDYGLSENAEDFNSQFAYSPVHNVKAGTCYPATLVTTADRDDRVVPWHSYKFAAALQAAQGCAKPVLIRIETRAGHGAGKPVWMQIEDYADQWAFIAKAIGMGTPGS
jgi:prolyl oligopeptidase